MISNEDIINRITKCLGRLNLIAGLVLSLMLSSYANAAQVKGAGEAEYKSRPNTEIKRQALVNAQLNAVERYISATSQSKVRLFESKRENIEANLDRLFTSSNIVKEEKNKNLKVYRIVISGEIDTNYLNEQLGGGGPIGGGEYLTFIFVARDQASIQQFDARKVAIKQNVQTQDSSDISNTSGNSYTNQASKHQTQKMEVGGSTTLKADKIAYSVSSSNEINTAMSGAFTEAGFEVVEAAYLEDETGGQISVEAFKRDYQSGEVAATTMKSAIAGLKDIDIGYFSVGTLDASIAQKDSTTGLPKVTVTVTAQVKSLKKRFPKTIASVGPVVYSATGPNPTAAKSNALKMAAENAASTLIAQLQSRGIN